MKIATFEMTAFENLSASQALTPSVILTDGVLNSLRQKLRASLHRDVRAICTEALHLLGMEMTKPAMEIVAELVYRKLSIYGTDLEAFSKHAKRNTINSEDVKLLVRRNPSLRTHLDKMQPSIPSAKDKRRKTVASTSKLTTPLSKPKETRPTSEGDKITEREIAEIRSEEVRRKEEEGSKEGESSKSEDSMEKRITSDVEHMSVDDTIVDLTFD